MAGEKERLTGIAITGLEEIDFNDIHEFLGPLKEHSLLDTGIVESRVVFDETETGLFFALSTEVSGRERGTLMYAATMGVVNYYRSKGVSCKLAVNVSAERGEFVFSVVKVEPDFPDGFSKRRCLQIARCARELGRDLHALFTEWKSTPEQRMGTFELPDFERHLFSYIN